MQVDRSGKPKDYVTFSVCVNVQEYAMTIAWFERVKGIKLNSRASVFSHMLGMWAMMAEEEGLEKPSLLKAWEFIEGRFGSYKRSGRREGALKEVKEKLMGQQPMREAIDMAELQRRQKEREAKDKEQSDALRALAQMGFDLSQITPLEGEEKRLTDELLGLDKKWLASQSEAERQEIDKERLRVAQELEKVRSGGGE